MFSQCSEGKDSSKLRRDKHKSWHVVCIQVTFKNRAQLILMYFKHNGAKMSSQKSNNKYNLTGKSRVIFSLRQCGLSFLI